MFYIMHRNRLLWLGALLVVGLLALAGLLISRRPVQNETQPPPRADHSLRGEYLSWSEVRIIFPKYARADIIDCETGRQFRVQRRGGSSHADVQPLTAADTKIMKAIYGKWSWKRRAIVLVLNDGRKVAASMNGMPHGAGAIQGNNFNGHFCLHFRDSKTHASRQTDPAHQVMIWKAAGRFELQMTFLPPEEVIRVFFTLLNQDDWKTARLLVLDSSGTPDWKPERHLDSIKINQLVKINPQTFQAELQAVFAGSSSTRTKKILLDMVPGPPYWRIQQHSLQFLSASRAWGN